MENVGTVARGPSGTLNMAEMVDMFNSELEKINFFENLDLRSIEAARSSEASKQLELLKSVNEKKFKQIEKLEAKIREMSQLMKSMESKIDKLSKKSNLVVKQSKLLALSANRSNEFVQFSPDDYDSAGLVYNKQIDSRQILRKVKIDELKRPKEYFSQVKNLTFLTHKNIYRYLDVWIELDCDDHQDRPTTLIMYILIDFRENRTLEKLINDGSFNRPSRRHLFGQIFSAYEYLQRDEIVHGYLQVSNIFMADESSLKIGEFGLTWNADYLHAQIEYLQNLVNDLGLIESDLLHEQTLGYKIDVYSLGIIYFYMCYPMKTAGFHDALHKMAYTCDSLSIPVQDIEYEDTKAIKTLLRSFKLSKGYCTLLGKSRIYLKHFVPVDEPRPKKVRLL